MSKIVQKIINANAQKSGSAVVGIAGARALNASEFLDDKHTVDTQSIDQATSVIEASLKNRYDYINYYAGGFNVARHLFNKNEQGVWFNPSDMTAGKAGWRRNLLTYSEQLTTSPWSANEASLESATPPSGIGLAWKLKETGNSGVHFVGRVLNTVLSASVQHTLSVYAKAGERNILSIVGESTATTLCDFDLSAGTAHPAASATGTITSVGDGWYRCSMTWTATASPSTTYFATKQSLAGGLVFTGTLNSGLFLAAAQLERASTPSEYQPITDFSTEFKAEYPTHTLYQDSNGVTPVTASGQPVGLILDQSRGGLGALGSELVTNGDFSSGQTGWIDSPVAPSGWSFTGGALVGSNAAGGYEQAVQVTSGKWYRCTITLSNVSGGAVSFAIAGAGVGPTFNSNGTNTVLINAGSTGNIGIVRRTSNFTGTIDNISIREVPGNHAYQSTSASRPTLARIPSSGRRNLLTRTEEFDNAAWNASAVGATVTPNTSTGPFGGTVADTISFTTTGLRYGDYTSPVALVGRTFTFSCWLASTTGKSTIVLRLTNSSDGSDNTRTAINLTSTLTRYSVTRTFTGAGNTVQIGFENRTALGGDGVAGDVIVFGGQLEESASATNYQKVGSTFDVTESGVSDLWHLVFDGSDDSLVTNSVDFSGTDEMTVIAGLRKLSDAAPGACVELTSSPNVNNGTFTLLVPAGASATIGYYSKGTGQQGGDATISAPVTAVCSGLSDISSDVTQLRINGTLQINDTDDQGTGNYSNAAIYIGRRGGAAVPFNGHLYQLIVRGKTTSTDQIEQVEDFVKRKSGLSY